MKILNRLSYNPLIVLIIVIKDLIGMCTELSNVTTIKIDTMEIMDLIIKVILVIWLIWVIIGIRRFASSVIDTIHHQQRLNQRIFEAHPQIRKEYLRDLEGLRKYSSTDNLKKSFYNMFIFSNKKLSEYELFHNTDLEYKSNESNRDNK